MSKLIQWKFLLLVALVGVTGCGGGGGGNALQDTPTDTTASGSVTKIIGSENGGPRVTLTAPSAPFQAQGIEGNDGQGTIAIAVDYTGVEQFWLSMEERGGLIRSGDAGFNGNQFTTQLSMRGDLKAGTYNSQVIVHICLDKDCSSGELPGSPFVHPIQYTITPNIAAQSSIRLQRSGQQPAPSIIVPVTIPTEAGQVQSIVTSSQPYAFDISFQNDQLQVNTKQTKAGIYEATVQLTSLTDPRYTKQITVRYQVDAPPSGEIDFAVMPSYSSIAVDQGKAISQKIKFTRPSWTAEWIPPRLVDSSAVFALKDLGNDEYEVVLNTQGLEAKAYTARVLADAGPIAGQVVATVTVYVAQPFYGTGFHAQATATSPASALAVKGQVITTDGAPAVWTVKSLSPWIRVMRESGVTGRDEVQLEVDQLALATFDWSNTAGKLSISLDRPDTSPITIGVDIDNQIPRIRRAINSTLTGKTARLFVTGKFSPYAQTVDQLKVSGARLVKQTLIWDSRFIGGEGVLALDLTDLTPGTPVKVRIDSTLSPSEVAVQAIATPVVPSGSLPLPFGVRRPPHFAASSNSLYFSGNGTVYRWAHDGTAWRALKSASVEGLIDIALNADETRLFAITKKSVVELDPSTLAQVKVGLFPGATSSFPGNEFAQNAWSGLNAFATTSDGRTFASVIGSYPEIGSRGISWIVGNQYWIGDNLADSPSERGPGPSTRYFGANPQFDSGLIRSPNGQTLIALQPDRMMRLYQTSTLYWSDFYQLAGDTTLAAISDDAQIYIQSDGVLFKQGVQQGPSVAGRLPQDYQAGGYGLSGDGKTVFIYGYKTDDSTGKPIASNAGIWAIDIHDLINTPLDRSPISANIALGSPLGCLPPTSSGETCAHAVTITTAQGSRSLFLSGPRGMAAVSLPDTALAATNTLTNHAQAMSLSRNRKTWSNITKVKR